MWSIHEFLHPTQNLNSLDYLRGTNITTCSQLTNCNACSNFLPLDCTWCSTTKDCVSSGSKSGACAAQLMGSCSDSYYSIIFIVIITVMLCICCLTCYLRRMSTRHDMSGLLSPLLSGNAHRAMFEDRTGEWMCVICGFDNKGRSKDCILCGTSHQFSLDYKNNKKEQRKQKKLMKKVSGLHNNTIQRPSAIGLLSKSPRTSFASGAGAVTKSRSNSHAVSESDHLIAIEEEETQAQNATADIDIPIPEDAQITSISMSLRNFDTSPMVPTNTNTTTVALNTGALLTNEEREEAMNYRRMNQLTLRQKSARRRKLWQRRFDKHTGTMVWMRVPVRETKVGSAPFGYTPRPSISESRRQQMPNNSVFSMLSSSINFSSSYNVDDPQNEALEDLLSAARAGGHGTTSFATAGAASGFDPQCMSPPPSTRMTFRPIADEETGEGRAGGEEGDVVRSSLHPRQLAPSAPLSTPQRRTRPKQAHDASPSKLTNFFHSLRFPGIGGHRQDRRWSRDSFDSAVVSTSPGYTSVFDEEGGLTWKKVESGMPISTNHYGGSVARPASTATTSTTAAAAAVSPNSPLTPNSLSGAHVEANNPVDPDSDPAHASAPAFDLHTIAAFTFREKHLWFLDRISELQKPWTEGFVKLEVRRAKLLDDSHRAWSQLRDIDMHKWFRFQFSNEPGIDAGGLEREWFTLTMEEIFSPGAGLFLACGSAGSNSSGVYHINPISGAINPNHLSFFRFIGRVFGKALMTQQPIRANLSLPLRKQIIGSPVTFSDLEFVDDELYRNLIWLKTQANEGHADIIESLCLDFSISYTAANQTVTYDLIDNGSNIAVTVENLDEYLQLRLRHRLLDSVKLQLENMLRGLYEVIPPEWLTVFDYQELDLLLCGVPELDLKDWMNNTEYMGEYRKQRDRHQVIRWFWKAVEGMSNEERVRLLQFTTGCARLPAQGFKALQSSDGRYRKFNIQSVSKEVRLFLFMVTI